jgi:TetR/AcrR family transcriptional regulator, transcriptional repressor for nem operon
MKPGKANTRRLTVRGAAMRERIVSAAADLVWAQGAGQTSLDDVMEKSGASKSQLHHFADKDALLREAAALQTKRVLATHGQLLDSLDSLDALRRWRDAVLALNRQDGCPLGALVYQLPQSAKRARTVVGDGFETWRMQVEKGLVKMRDRGELSRDASPADIALAVLAALQGGLLLSKGEKSNRPLEVAFEMALAYVAAHDPRAAGECKPIRTG